MRWWWLAAVVALAACGDDSGPSAWNPALTDGPLDDSSTAEPTATVGASTETGVESCEPGTVEPCLCPDGLSLGEHACQDDGVGFDSCMCEDDTGSADSSSGDPMPPLPEEVCYLGDDGAGTTCLPLVAFYADLPRGYAYPPSMLADGQDRPPLGLIDVQAASGALGLAPNFDLDELAQPALGQWAVIQPHAVVALQAMRDAAGPITVVAGYRSPSANATAGGELYARHQYGDGFDLDPVDATLSTLADLCVAQGGAAVEFVGHVHCELSAVPVDEAFFGPPPMAAPISPGGLALEAWIEIDGHQLWAPGSGFVEGEPGRRWTARDEGGAIVGQAHGRSFAPPAGTRWVEVVVGGAVTRTLDLGSPV